MLRRGSLCPWGKNGLSTDIQGVLGGGSVYRVRRLSFPLAVLVCSRNSVAGSHRTWRWGWSSAGQFRKLLVACRQEVNSVRLGLWPSAGIFWKIPETCRQEKVLARGGVTPPIE
jgi:hypothetical protein